MLVWQIQTDVIMIGLLGAILIHIRYRTGTDKRINCLAQQILKTIIGILFLEIISVFLEGEQWNRLRAINEVINGLGFMGISVMLILGIEYLNEWLWMSCSIKIKRNNWWYLPAWVNVLLSLLNIKTHWIGNVDRYNIYHRGPLYWTIPVLVIFYIGVAVGIIIKCRKKMGKENLQICSLSIGLIAIAIGLQNLYEEFLIIWPMVGMVMLVDYMVLLIYKIRHDPLTGLENREAYLEYIHSLKNRVEVELTVISIDLDDFKRVNDQFGHMEGDEALRKISELMKQGFKKGTKMIRMGGDEFLIFIETSNEWIVNEQMATFSKIVEAYNESSGKPYDLKFSYGKAVYEQRYKDMATFLNEVDQMMYEQKRQKKQKNKKYIKGI